MPASFQLAKIFFQLAEFFFTDSSDLESKLALDALFNLIVPHLTDVIYKIISSCYQKNYVIQI